MALPTWMEQAACQGMSPDLFFPQSGNATNAARRVCGHCTVRADCLSYALRRPERHGIWGGVTVFGRNKLRRQARTK